MDVSVIIVNYNTKELLLQCLKSLFDKTIGVNFEVIVVDNASTDDSVEVVSRLYPNVCLVRSSINLGFGKANNLGYKYATGKYIFLLNPDTVLLNNAIEILYNFMEDHFDIAISGGQLYDAEGNYSHSYYLFLPSFLWEINILLCQYIHKMKDSFFRKKVIRDGYGFVSYITGADMMIRKDNIEQHGFFDPDFFMYFEETELSSRYKHLDKKIAFVISSEIVHLEGKSFAFKESRERMFFQGRKLYYSKCHSKVYSFFSDIIYICTCFSRIVIYLIIFRKQKISEWYKRLNLFLSI